MSQILYYYDLQGNLQDDIDPPSEEDTEDDANPNGEELVLSPHSKDEAILVPPGNITFTAVPPSVPRGNIWTNMRVGVSFRLILIYR